MENDYNWAEKDISTALGHYLKQQRSDTRRSISFIQLTKMMLLLTNKLRNTNRV